MSAWTLQDLPRLVRSTLSLVTETWDLEIGAAIKRTELHRRFGGRRQGGIGPSAQSPSVFIFSDPASGLEHGYRDGWSDDGTFHYTGEGQRGDQQFTHGNRAIRDHGDERRSLRVFDGTGGEVTYVGEFELPAVDPWYHDDAPQTGGGPLRQVIIFRLLPHGNISPAPPDLTPVTSGAGPGAVEIAELEAHRADTFERSPNSEPLQGARRESLLVLNYTDFLRGKGRTVTRHRYWPERHGRSLVCDVFDETTRRLIESKSSCSREAIRMAIGQLLDYQRFEDSPPDRLVLLLPEVPRPDLVDLALGLEIDIVYPTDQGWETLEARSGSSEEVLKSS